MHKLLTISIIGLLALVGCAKSDIASVEGTITMDGEPVEGASIIFRPPGGRPAGARTDAEGHYQLNYSGGRKGALPGLNRVQISTQADPYEDEAGNPVAASKETIPMEYNTESKLEFTVVQGENNIANFDLQSGGPIARGTAGE